MSSGNYFSQYLLLTQVKGRSHQPNNLMDVQVANELNEANIVNHYNDVNMCLIDSCANNNGALLVTDGQQIFSGNSSVHTKTPLKSFPDGRRVLPRNHGRNYQPNLIRHDN